MVMCSNYPPDHAERSCDGRPGTGGGIWAMFNVWLGVLLPYYYPAWSDANATLSADIIYFVALVCLSLYVYAARTRPVPFAALVGLPLPG